MLEFLNFKLNFELDFKFKIYEEEFKDVFYSIITIMLFNQFPFWTTSFLEKGHCGSIHFQCKKFIFILNIDYNLKLKNFEIHEYSVKKRTFYKLNNYNELYNKIVTLTKD